MEIINRKIRNDGIFFGQGPVRCEIAVDNKCLQQITFSQILGILKQQLFKPNLIEKFSRIKVHNALAVPILL